MEFEIQSQKTVTAVVLADTHIPDRVKRLHPELLAMMETRAVDLILHAGDISQQRVLEQLSRVAPVYAVRGNRDFLLARSLPVSRRFMINGVCVYLTHGHLNMYDYWRDKLENVLHGYQFERYYMRLTKVATNADVVLYGHSHHAEKQERDGKLFFNPGSCSVAEKPDYRLSFGIIQFFPRGEVEAEIIPLSS